MNAFAYRLAIAGLGAAVCVSVSDPSFAADAAPSCKGLLPMQAVVVERADQGIDELRRYVFISRGVHQLDMTEVAGSLDAWRAQARCAKQSAERAASIPPVAMQTRP